MKHQPVGWARALKAFARMKAAWAGLRAYIRECDVSWYRLKAARLMLRSVELDPWPIRQLMLDEYERGVKDALEELERRGIITLLRDDTP